MARVKGNRRRYGSYRFITRFITHGVLFVFCIVLMLAGKADITMMNSARSVLTGLVVPIVDIVSVPFRAGRAMLDNMAAVANLREENLRLQDDVERLRQWRRKAEILQSENRQLRSVSNVAIPEDTTPISARVIAVNADSFAHSVMVNVGEMAGIKKGNAAVTTAGLVGIVVDSGAKHAQILLITDINAMIPVILSLSSWPGATVGQNSKQLQLRFLATEAVPQLGELVQTSGHGGVLPPGIPVGRIAGINNRRISIQPVADLERLSFITILTTKTDTNFTVEALNNQRFSPLPKSDEGFSLEGINAIGQKTESDLLAPPLTPEESQ